jgi:aspartyl/asparaginyl beta-hydroxylase (cupin superfamily)
MHAVRLMRTYDPDALQEAVARVHERLQEMPAGYPGEGHLGWTSVCLHSPASGRSPVLEAAPYLRHVMDDLGIRIRLARLLALRPAGVIREHRDAFLSNAIVRLHVPIVTDPAVEFYLDGQRCDWLAGELWYGDFSRPHHARNGSALTRIHLVIDATIDAQLAALFPGQPPPRVAAMLEPGAAADWDEAVLQRFEFDFLLPAGFALPGAGHEPLPAEARGALRLVDSELCVFVNDQPLLKAAPASEDTLDVLGLGVPATLQYTFAGERASQVALAIGSHVVHTFLGAAAGA